MLLRRSSHAACVGAMILALAGCNPLNRPPSIEIGRASLIELPGACWPDEQTCGDADCNSPVHWHDGAMYVFCSVFHPYRSGGPDLFHLSLPRERVTFDNQRGWTMGGRWLEATWRHDDGTLYGWYHNEPPIPCQRTSPRDWSVTAPRIGAAVSHDNGLNWRDMGIVLEAPPDSLVCDTPNGYFAGGNGDFSVIPDRKNDYLYFFISTYHGDVAEQGICIARMRYADRDQPVGKVFKWHDGSWCEPGIGGHVTPIIPVTNDWHAPLPDAVWGPGIHWNTHLRQYVMLFNRSIDARWKMEGVYVTFNPDLHRPERWAAPVKVMDGPGDEQWYPQVIGIGPGESDKLAGRVARLFVRGESRWEIRFRAN